VEDRLDRCCGSRSSSPASTGLVRKPRYVVHPEWYENKEPVSVVTSCGILNTGDEDLADSLIIGGLYSFELRDVTVGQNARRHIVKATLE
ncbi:hypothetical protein NVV99_25230, partial [Rhodococcus sp. PAE-6]|uniref:hypothetical protein n=2 Tax=unclassified Rhodococcus (in: high G+C Gram-positive bacteria) TaxID=192944 RepID=UPI0021B345D4